MSLITTVYTLLCLAVSARSLLIRRELTAQDYPGAVCNDGRPALIYHSLTRPTNRNFIIFLQGGYFCTSIEECEERCRTMPFFCSPNDNPTLVPEGIMSDDPEVNPVFSSYYKVYVQYCSSDFYIGNGEPTEENGGYYFKGRAHVTAAVNSLKSLVGLGPGDRLLVTGISAGGRGVAFNSEYIASLLPDVDIRCIVDAAIFYPNWEQNPFSEDCRSFNNIMSDANDYFDGVLESFDVNTWWKSFKLPLLISIQTFDCYAYMYFCINETDTAHLQKWADGMKEVAMDLEKTAPHVGLFVPGCYGHPLLRLDYWLHEVRVGPNQLTYAETIANWLEGDGPIHAWDDCSNNLLNCNDMCKIDKRCRL